MHYDRLLSQDDIVSPEEERTLLQCSSPKLRACWSLLLNSGMRQQEMRLLDLSDLRRDTGVLRIPDLKLRDKSTSVEERSLLAQQGLNRSHVLGFREVQLGPECASAWEYLRGGRDLGPLLVGKNGRSRASRTYLTKAFKREWRRLGFREAVVLHSFRHTYCTRWVEANPDKPLTILMHIVGHKSLNTTSRYLHTDIKQRATG